MKVSILVPTLGTRLEELTVLFDSLAKQTNMSFEMILVSQGNHETIELLLNNYSFSYKQIKIHKKGLSHARNVGMTYVTGDIVLLSDDDAWYPEGAIEIILRNFNSNEFDVICFEIFDPISQKYYKNYKTHKKNVAKRQILKKSSIEICFNLSKIKKENLIFDENFGLGTKYTSGEENLLLDKLRKQGFIIKYIDEIIVYHRKKEAILIDITFVKTKSEICKRILGHFYGYIFVNLLLIKNFNNINNIPKLNAFLEVLKTSVKGKIESK